MKTINRSILYSILALLLINLSACEKLTSFEDPPTSVSAYKILLDDGNYSYFRSIVDKAALREMLDGSSQSTFFIPTNSAFLNAGYTTTILANMPVEDVAILVKNHIITSKIDVNTTGPSQEQTTASGIKITIQTIGNSKFVDGGDITNVSQVTTNGYVNIINKLLVAKGTLNDVISNYAHATGNSQLTFLAAAIARASTGSTNITAMLSGANAYTLFAPNNGAFIEAGYTTIAMINTTAPNTLGALLRSHLMSGTKLTTAFDSLPQNSDAGTPIYFDRILREPKTITTRWFANGITFGNSVPSNLRATNGVMHIISRILPTPVTTNTLARINADPTLTMFSALITRASTADPKFNFASILADPLRSYTVFAVNNAGLQAAGYANVAAINATSPAILADILKLHMVPKRVNNINIGDNGGVPSLYYAKNGSTGILEPISLTFTFTSPVTTNFKVKGPTNTATISVITPNVVTTNGILNTIGSLLTP